MKTLYDEMLERTYGDILPITIRINDGIPYIKQISKFKRKYLMIKNLKSHTIFFGSMKIK